MDRIRNNINKSFHNLFGNNIHPFFEDIYRVNKLSKEYKKNQIKLINNMIKFDENVIVPEGKIIKPKYNVLQSNRIDELKKEMSNVMNWNKILRIVSFMSQYLLRSNVMDEGRLYDNIKKHENTINIMIIGSGPVGLFLACYLNLYYNKTTMNSIPRVNVVIYDSRMEKPGFRKPYTRQRPFATSSSYLNLIIPKIYCWNETTQKDYLYVNIFMLEYLLYTTAITQYNVSIIYNDYNWDDYKNIIQRGNFKVVFDCTGGRLKHDAIKNVDDIWFNTQFPKNKQIDIRINKKLDVRIHENIVELTDYIDKTKKIHKFKKNMYYGSISIHRNDDSLTFINKYDINIINNYDMMYLSLLKNKQFTFPEIITIISGISDTVSRNFLYSIMLAKKSLYNDCIIMIDVFTLYIRHALKISDIITINNRKVLYIGAGDTIFHSHFITGAGLNRILDFTVKCANMIGDIPY